MTVFEIDAAAMDLKTANKEIKKAILQGKDVVVRNADHLDGLGSGIGKGNITIEGDVADYAFALNDGMNAIVRGNAGSFIADGMTRGLVVVEGDAGYGAAEYCYGGIVIIKGNAGDFLGAMNKGALITVTGNAGDDIGTYMVGGEIIVLQDVGDRVANWIIRGEVFIGGGWTSLGHNCKQTGVDYDDAEKISGILKQNDIEDEFDIDVKSLKKLVPIRVRPFY